MIDDELVRKAIRILSERGSRNMSVQDAIDLLASYPSFEDMDDGDLEPIATTALARCAQEPQPSPRPTSSGAARAGRPASTRPAPDASMLTAPYRFVTIDDQVVLAPDEVKKACWGFPLANGYSGEIDVEWAFETPMLIGVADEKGVSGPMKLGDDYIIPGASLRGAMRAAMGIVTRARLAQVSKNHRYGVRDFTHPLFKEGQGAGAQRLAWDNLRAGWLRKSKATKEDEARGLGDYVLTPCDKKIIRIRALPKSMNGGRPTDNGEWHKDWLQTKLPDRYRDAGYADPKDKNLFDFETGAKTSFMRDPQARQNDPTSKDQVIPSGASGGMEGWFVFSAHSPTAKSVSVSKLDDEERAPGPGNQKKREYVFLDGADARETRLSQAAFEEFERINSKPGKTSPKPDGSYAVLAPTLEKGRRIPVFYVGNPSAQAEDPDFAMGLTRLFKLPHVNSVGDVLARQQRHKLNVDNPDMVEALFGYVYDDHDLGRDTKAESRDAPSETARKGRVSFGFARLSRETPARGTSVVTTIAMAPRASYAPFYLRGPIKDWTDEATNRRKGDARLAGRKRYFPRFPSGEGAGAEDAILTTLQRRDNADAKDSRSQLRLLAPRQKGGKLVFSGTIRLHNVLAEEIGALLWTLTHGGDASKRHMIGRSKNAGAGQARVTVVGHSLKANKALTDADGNGLGDLTQFMTAFNAHMRKSDARWPDVDDIKEFLRVSDPATGAQIVADGKKPAIWALTPRLAAADMRMSKRVDFFARPTDGAFVDGRTCGLIEPRPSCYTFRVNDDPSPGAESSAGFRVMLSGPFYKRGCEPRGRLALQHQGRSTP